MKLMYVAAALAVLGMTGAAHAEPATNPDESAFTLNLDAATGKTFYVKCSNGKNLLNCQNPSVWEQYNGYPGLQTAVMKVGSVRFDPDMLLLG